jgi:hypothetical protein
VLNVGARFGKVRRNVGDVSHYQVHGDVHSALSSLRARILMSAAAAPQLQYGARDGGGLNEQRAGLAHGHGAQAIAGPRVSSTGSGTNPQRVGIREQESVGGIDALHHWQENCRIELLKALNINHHDADMAINGQGVGEAAFDAWKALERLAINGRVLGALLKRHRDSQMHALGDAYSRRLNMVPNNPEKKRILDEVDKWVEQWLPALMLFPENGLVHYLIDELERAAGPDNGQQHGEQALRTMLCHVRDSFASERLADASEWQKISAAFDAHASDQHNIFVLRQNAARNAR